jgi:hypothetical protein
MAVNQPRGFTFGEQKAHVLSRLADREGLESRTPRTGVRYARPLPQRDHTYICKPDSDIAKGASGTVTIYVNEQSIDEQVTAKALGAAVTAAKWCLVWQEPGSGNQYVWPWEC